MSKASDKLFLIMSFQYKPIEASLLKRLSVKDAKKYGKLDSSMKIRILDNYARDLGL